MAWQNLSADVLEEFCDAQAPVLARVVAAYATRLELARLQHNESQAAYYKTHKTDMRRKNAEYFATNKQRLHEKRKQRLTDPTVRAARNAAQRRRYALRQRAA